MRDVFLDGLTLRGEAYDPMQDAWVEFEVDLPEGTVKGGSYDT